MTYQSFRRAKGLGPSATQAIQVLSPLVLEANGFACVSFRRLTLNNPVMVSKTNGRGRRAL